MKHVERAAQLYASRFGTLTPNGHKQVLYFYLAQAVTNLCNGNVQCISSSLSPPLQFKFRRNGTTVGVIQMNDGNYDLRELLTSAGIPEGDMTGSTEVYVGPDSYVDFATFRYDTNNPDYFLVPVAQRTTNITGRKRTLDGI